MTRGGRKEHNGFVETKAEICSSFESFLLGKAPKPILRNGGISGDYFFLIDTVQRLKLSSNELGSRQNEFSSLEGDIFKTTDD